MTSFPCHTLHVCLDFPMPSPCRTLQHTVTHCNKLQHTATLRVGVTHSKLKSKIVKRPESCLHAYRKSQVDELTAQKCVRVRVMCGCVTCSCMRVCAHACVLLGFDAVSLHTGLLSSTIHERASSFVLTDFVVVLTGDLLEQVRSIPHNGRCLRI